jgi:DNA mismatch repair protein MutS
VARAIAYIDVLSGLSILALEGQWICPTLVTNLTLDIRGGRHPVVEQSVGSSLFIPNDTYLDETRQMMVITGPNMAGKSTYIRQVALLVVMAQIGSFIPATSATVGLVDQIFSRIGASDLLAQGQSTFMVEMSETAYILQHATSHSLVILDEIGRGTSTYDGIAIAWAVACHLLSTPTQRAKTLFATHYAELCDLATHYTHVQNYQVAVKETSQGITFLRTIRPGGTNQSYGIHVAQLAGLPPSVIKKAKDKLRELHIAPTPPPSPATLPWSPPLDTLNPLEMTPLEALEQLILWKKQWTSIHSN